MKWLTYFNERFPFQSHIPIILTFSFSAICYSYMASNQSGKINYIHYIVAFIFCFTLFLLLRISDEFKDNEDDLKYRTYLPVPRGLISLKELKGLAIIIISIHIILLFFFQFFVLPYFVTIAFLTLMHNEFFIKDWLKQNQFFYVLSHMLIIPLVDLVASVAHWGGNDIHAPKALIFFFVVSLLNGVILEVGRKIKTKEFEEYGVVSYSKLLGESKSVMFWIGLLIVTMVVAMIASKAIQAPTIVFFILVLMAILCSIPAFLFWKNPNQKRSKFIEISSGIWTIAMYFSLGILPYILR